nr:MAG TPA: hypothetical protein [Caudoviricetes sp.]
MRLSMNKEMPRYRGNGGGAAAYCNIRNRHT